MRLQHAHAVRSIDIIGATSTEACVSFEEMNNLW